MDCYGEQEIHSFPGGLFPHCGIQIIPVDFSAFPAMKD